MYSQSKDAEKVGDSKNDGEIISLGNRHRVSTDSGKITFLNGEPIKIIKTRLV